MSRKPNDLTNNRFEKLVVKERVYKESNPDGMKLQALVAGKWCDILSKSVTSNMWQQGGYWRQYTDLTLA